MAMLHQKPTPFGPEDLSVELADLWSGKSSVPIGRILEWLIHEIPIEMNGKLVFIPRILQLPRKVQKDTLSWFVEHFRELPRNDLMVFLQALDPHQPLKDSWVELVVNLLKKKAKPDSPMVYMFSPQTQSTYSDLIEKCFEAAAKNEVFNPWRSANITPPVSLTATESHGDQSVDKDVISPSMNKSSHLTQVTDHTGSSLGNRPESQTELPDKIQEDLDALLDIWKSAESVAVNVPPQVRILVDSPPSQFELVCRKLGLDDLSEVSLSTACGHISSLGSQLSHHNSILITKYSLLTRITDLTQNPSRTLITCVKAMFDAFPQAVLEAVLIPSLTSGSVSAPQADVIIRVVKEYMTPGNRQSCFCRFVNSDAKWTEPIIAVVQTLVDLKTELDEQTLSEIVERLRQVDDYENPKVAKLILGIIQKYGKMITVPLGSELKIILLKNKSFVRKPALAALNKLKLEIKS